MIEDIKNKLQSGKALTMNEVETFLNFEAVSIRRKVGITDPYDTNCAKCAETRFLTGVSMFNNNCDCELLPIKKLLNIELTHYATAVEIPTIEGMKWYLMDLTYSQFFQDKYLLDDGTYMPLKKDFVTDIESRFADDLRKKGYVELTRENIKLYIDSFLNAYSKVRHINRNEIYQSVNQYLSDKGIKYSDSLSEERSAKIEELKQMKNEITSQIIKDDNSTISNTK